MIRTHNEEKEQQKEGKNHNLDNNQLKDQPMHRRQEYLTSWPGFLYPRKIQDGCLFLPHQQLKTNNILSVLRIIQELEIGGHHRGRINITNSVERPKPFRYSVFTCSPSLGRGSVQKFCFRYI